MYLFIYFVFIKVFRYMVHVTGSIKITKIQKSAKIVRNNAGVDPASNVRGQIQQIWWSSVITGSLSLL